MTMTTRTTVLTLPGYPAGLVPTGAGQPGDVHEHDLDTVLGWRGRTVRDREGEKIGTLGELFLDRETDRPAWAGIKTGLLGRRESIVPLGRMVEDGDELRVPYGKDEVRDAPGADPDVALAPDEERALYEHYGESWTSRMDQPPGEDEMVRSEEEPVVRPGDGEMRPVERVRLRKVTVTEQQQRTIPVRREEIRLETDPPPEGEVERVEDV
jgi:PRC-barrel domain protein